MDAARAEVVVVGAGLACARWPDFAGRHLTDPSVAVPAVVEVVRELFDLPEPVLDSHPHR